MNILIVTREEIPTGQEPTTVLKVMTDQTSDKEPGDER